MSQKSISAVVNFYHDNHKDGEYQIRYNGVNLGVSYVHFHYQSDKWVLVLKDIHDKVEESLFDTNGKISYNKNSNTLKIEQHNVVVEIFC